MDFLTTNRTSARAQKRSLGGRTYLVCPVVMIKQGVLAGNNGPILYTNSVVSKRINRWNGVPLTLGHPEDENGNKVSARDPESADRFQIGVVYNSRFSDNKLKGEAWFDIQQLNKLAPGLQSKLVQGERVELSTGLFTYATNKSGTFKGRSYKQVLQGYEPDHLAVLTSEKGACSLSDGCGVNTNAAVSARFQTMTTNAKTKRSNCGIGSGGFQPGNKCAKGGRGSKASGAGRRGTSGDVTTKPPPGKAFKPNVRADKDKDGVTDSARVGIPAKQVAPPPKVGRLPNLTPHERKVESDFRDAFHKDPDGMAKQFRDIVTSSTKPGEPPTFGTDDAKVLSDAWSGKNLTLEQRSQNRATLNLPLHQTANAVTKRAFVQHLDTMEPGQEIMVTVGGCGAGKGYALKNVPQAMAVKKKSNVVWDSAGDQNATENAWIQGEAEKRGLKVNYVHVHADPFNQWAHPERGVVKRAQDPNDGRMVDAHVFADSYSIGAKNHQAFFERNKNNKNASFTFLENGSPPKLLSGIPKEAFVDQKKLLAYATEVVSKPNIPAHVRRGATMGQRIWDSPTGNQEAEWTNVPQLMEEELVVNKDDAYTKWLDEELARANALSALAIKKGYTVKTGPDTPPKLDKEGGEVDGKDEKTDKKKKPTNNLQVTVNSLSDRDVRAGLESLLYASIDESSIGSQHVRRPYLQDVYPAYFTYRVGDQVFKRNYDRLEDSLVLKGEPVQVVSSTVYRPIKRKSKSIEFQPTSNAGANCGIGPGGFQPGDKCAKGGKGGKGTSYQVTDKSGKTKMMSTDEIKNLVYG